MTEQQVPYFGRANIKRPLLNRESEVWLSLIFSKFFCRRQNVQLTRLILQILGYHCFKVHFNHLRTAVTNTARNKTPNKPQHMRYLVSFWHLFFFRTTSDFFPAASFAHTGVQGVTPSSAATGLWQSWTLQLTILIIFKRSWKINK